MVRNYQVKVTPGQSSAIGNALALSHGHHEKTAEGFGDVSSGGHDKI